MSASVPTDPLPLVSIIVPSFRMGRFLGATLDSIFSQDYRPIEVLVLDGGSDDDTVAILERYGAEHEELRWISEPDEGPADAVNKGLAMAQGEIAGIQSADDVYLPGAISTAVAAFARFPSASIAYGDAEIIDAHGGYIWGPTRYLPYTLPRYLVGSTFIPQSSAFFRPEIARAVGGCRAEYFVFDVDLWVRMLFRAPAVKIDAVMSAYRRHEVQRDKEAEQIRSSWRRMLAESPEIRAAPWRVRRAARAAGHLITQHYNPTGSAWHQAAEIWRALLIYPPAARALWKPKMLIPPRPTARGALGRLRQLAATAR